MILILGICVYARTQLNMIWLSMLAIVYRSEEEHDESSGHPDCRDEPANDALQPSDIPYTGIGQVADSGGRPSHLS
jgi:hypothetical protein